MSFDMTQLGWQLVAALFAVLGFVSFGPPMRRWDSLVKRMDSLTKELEETGDNGHRHAARVKALEARVDGLSEDWRKDDVTPRLDALAAAVDVHGQSFNNLANGLDELKVRVARLEMEKLRRMG